MKKTNMILAAIAASALLGTAPLHAQTWSDTGTDWGTAANWTTPATVPNSATATATFNGTTNNQPTVGTGNFTITRLNVNAGSSNVTLSGTTGNLTLTSDTNSTLISVAADKSLTFNSGVTFGSAFTTATQWQPLITAAAGSVIEFASGSTVTSNLSSGNNTSNRLRFNGAGTVNINGTVTATIPMVLDLTGAGGTLNWDATKTGTVNPNAAGEGSQINIFKTVNTFAYGTSGNGTRTIMIRADNVGWLGINTMGGAGTTFTNRLGIDDGDTTAISASLQNLNLSTNSANGTNEFFAGDNDTLRFTGTIQRSGGIATTITKSGNGTLALSGSNTYSDAILVSAGTLLLDGASGAITASSGVTVAAGATFTNNSAISFTRNLTLTEGVAGSIINGTGTFAAGNMTISSNLSDGFTTFALGSATLTKGGNLELTLSGITEGTYTLFSGGTIGGAFDSLSINGFDLTPSGSNFSGTTGGYGYTFTNDTNLLTVIPEPSTWALLAVGLTAMTILRRRRQS